MPIITFGQKRKEKRWIVWARPIGGTLYYKDGTDSYGDPIYKTVTGGEGWVLVGEKESFDLAKQLVVQQAGTLGLDNVKLTRAVDLHTVLYPIA